MESRLSKNIRTVNKRVADNRKLEEEWAKYVSISQQLTKENDTMTVSLSLTPFMSNALHEFWRYERSLTTPPCAEHAIWTIFRTLIILLDYQFNPFSHDLFYESYRGSQPLYYRRIYRSFKNKIISTRPDQNSFGIFYKQIFLFPILDKNLLSAQVQSSA
ncbi:unnamed protein product [Adineta ricciae]|uniref:Alpha-carbonic anhydrase domain-containing protein n=1 Tax=Adineta ricciae TaxID=249248 RepID=A0A814XVL3_ADIRI|nr:unnamed protein product [Adineta ricciae]